MIRHSSSFLISVTIHVALLMALFFAWKNYSDTKQERADKICLKLCSVESTENKAEKIEHEKAQRVDCAVQNKSKELEKKIVTADKPEDTKPAAAVTKEEKTELITDSPSIMAHDFRQEVKIAHAKLSEPQKEEQKFKKEEPSEEYLKINTQKIAQLLKENLYYPISARKRNISGLVVVKFTLGIDARVYDIKIAESKSDILSRAAIKTIEDLSLKFPKPKEEIVLSVPINYTLN